MRYQSEWEFVVQQNEKAPILQLDEEILLNIFRQVKNSDRMTLSHVCSHFRRLLKKADDPRLERRVYLPKGIKIDGEHKEIVFGKKIIKCNNLKQLKTSIAIHTKYCYSEKVTVILDSMKTPTKLPDIVDVLREHYSQIFILYNGNYVPFKQEQECKRMIVREFLRVREISSISLGKSTPEWNKVERVLENWGSATNITVYRDNRHMTDGFHMVRRLEDEIGNTIVVYGIVKEIDEDFNGSLLKTIFYSPLFWSGMVALLPSILYHCLCHLSTLFQTLFEYLLRTSMY